MYQLLNCLPIGPSKIIRRIKLISKKASQGNLFKSSPVSLSKSNVNINVLNKKYKGDLLDDLNENKVVKLVSYSDLNTTIDELDGPVDKDNEFIDDFENELRSEFDSESLDLKQEASLSKLNSTILDKIMEEMEEIDSIEEELNSIHKNEIVIKEELNKTNDSKDETINGQILHELHVHSIITNPPAKQESKSTFNDLCTLVNEHVDDVCNNVEEIIKKIQKITYQNNDSQFDTNNSTDTTTFFELLSPFKLLKEFETNNRLTATATTLDEPDSEKIPNNSAINLPQINQSTTNLILNDNLTANKLNESSTQNLTNTCSNTLIKNATNQLSAEQLDDAKCTNTTKTNKKLIQDTDLRTNAILNGVETWIELNKGSNCALGINLIDRLINDEKLFLIHEIVEQGIAETDQRLKIGDVILQVNDQPLKDMSCEEAIEHLNRTMGSVKLLIYRELICINDQLQSNENLNKSSIDTKSSSSSLKVNYSTKSTMQENERDENVEQKVINGKLYEIIQVELHKKPNKGLGLCIVNDNGKSPGPYISEILANSVAHLEGRLKKGDHIVSVNGEDVTNSYSTTLSMLKCLQGLVTLKIARLMPGQVVSLDSFDRNQHKPVEPTKINFKIFTLNLEIKKNKINRKASKSMNDKVTESVLIKDTDSVATDFSFLNDTILSDWDTKDLKLKNQSTISKNWIKIDKSKASIVDEILNQQLANLNCQKLEELIKENKILEIDGQQFDNSLNGENLIDKLKRSKTPIQMIVLN